MSWVSEPAWWGVLVSLISAISAFAFSLAAWRRTKVPRYRLEVVEVEHFKPKGCSFALVNTGRKAVRNGRAYKVFAEEVQGDAIRLSQDRNKRRWQQDLPDLLPDCYCVLTFSTRTYPHVIQVQHARGKCLVPMPLPVLNPSRSNPGASRSSYVASMSVRQQRRSLH